MKISRKTLVVILGILTAVVAVFQQEFGLSITLTTAVAGLVALMVYLFGEFKQDLARIRSQAHRWADPKFWIAIVAAVLAVLNTELGLGLPANAIIAVLTIIMGILFKKNVATT